MTNGATRTGSCQCGSVRYEVPRDMKLAAKCHCQMCQKSTGTGAMTAVVYGEDELKLSGAIKGYTYTSDGGNPVTTMFCPNCGSGLYMTTPLFPGLLLLRAGTLDDSTGVDPQFVVFNKRRPAWDGDNPNVPHFPEMPPK